MTQPSDARMQEPGEKKAYQTPELVEEGRFSDLTEVTFAEGDEDNPYGPPASDLS